MAPPQKSTKQATKGAKQIVEENIATLNFYRNMAIVANAVSLIILCIYNTSANIACFLFAAVAYICSYQFMAYIARPKYTDSGQLLDSGIDLNMEGGIAENVKDIIILTAACQLMSVMSNYFWLLWLCAPARACWLLWGSVLRPWLQQAPDTQPEVDEKKQRKMERRMKRMQH